MFHINCPGLSECESFATVTDGSSNTIVVGEVHRTEDDDPNDSRASYWAYSSEFQSTSNLYPVSDSIRVRNFWDCVARLPSPKPCVWGQWFSYHPGGINWLMCDGAIRHVSVNVDIHTLCRPGSIADGEGAQAP